MDRRTTRRGPSPFARRPHRTPPPPRSAASFPIPSHRAVPPGWKRSQGSVFWFSEPWDPALFSQQRQMGTRCFASTRGPCGVGGRAFRGLTRYATEWSAARRKQIRPPRCLSDHQFCRPQGRTLPTSDRRKFPSGNFRSARDLEGAERVNPRKARTPTPQVRPHLLANQECPHFFLVHADFELIFGIGAVEMLDAATGEPAHLALQVPKLQRSAFEGVEAAD
jgi:hypothetical protein